MAMQFSGEQRKWWKEAVVYQIYPRSFADSNGDGIGDLNGITAHLDYLKELGVDALWLSPVYASPNDDNGYDISDYQAIMPEFGTMADFDRLLHETHARGMKLIMDLVVNHTSDEHRWFVESRSSRDNPYRDYYIWKDPVDGHAPNNWGSCFSGSAWEWDEKTGQYYLHLFSKKQPDLNWANPAVRQEVYAMMRWWCDKGVDGFRMDVIGSIGKTDFLDGPMAPGALFASYDRSCCNTELTHAYLREMHREVLGHYDLLTVGETDATWEQAVRYTSNNGEDELASVFFFEHTNLHGDAQLGKFNDHPADMPSLRAALNHWQLDVQGKGWNGIFLSNHDQPRHLSRFGNDAPLWRVRSAKMLATLLHMLRGTPYVYQGEELGMINAGFTDISQYRDVESLNAWKQWVESGLVDGENMLRYFALRGRDNARTPMQWKNAPNAGFTTGTPWISCQRNYSEINAEDAQADPDSVYHYYRRLIALRHQYDVIVYGAFAPLAEDNRQVYAYERRLGDQVLTVACNFTDQVVPFAMEGEELICSYPRHREGSLYPYEARVTLRRA